MKRYADIKPYVRPSNIVVGDTVFVKRDDNKTKSEMPYDPKCHTLVGKKGSMLTAEAENEVQVTRNSSFFKKVRSSENTPVYNKTAPDKAEPQNNEETTDVVESEAATRTRTKTAEQTG